MIITWNKINLVCWWSTGRVPLLATPDKVNLAANGRLWIFQLFYVIKHVYEFLNGQFVWWKCVFGQFLYYCGPTQVVTNDQSSPNLVCDFFVYEWLLLWCEEVLATICLVFVDENPYFEPKMVYKWCSERKPTSPIELPMLLDDDLHIDEDWTLILRQRIKATQNCSSRFRILQIFWSISTPTWRYRFFTLETLAIVAALPIPPEFEKTRGVKQPCSILRILSSALLLALAHACSR